MLDLNHFPSSKGVSDVQEFFGTAILVGTSWQIWTKPRGKTMCHIFLLGHGGNGGLGAVGANSTAAGGGGGGSGGQTILVAPLEAIPDVLFLSLGGIGSGVNVPSYICITPDVTVNNVLAIANSSNIGANASGGSAGTGAAAPAAATAGTMPIGWAYTVSVLAGQAGANGGANVVGGSITLPVTGLLVTGGCGGGGLPATATTGTNGGAYTVAGIFPAHLGGAGGASPTIPPNNGTSGYPPIPKLSFWYGGTGGGSTHGSASGAGLIASVGGSAGVGCGAGGNGGALTGTPVITAVGQGGVGYCRIVCW
jgi:hypothetical protein